MTDSAVAAYVDRSFAIRFAGVLLLIGGGLFALLGLAQVGLGLAGAQEMTAAMGRWMILLSGGVYAALGAVLLALGGGLVALRRWARAIGAAAFWLWLADGVFLLITLPALHVSESTGGPVLLGAAGGFFLILLVAFTVVFMLVLPGGLLWAVGGADARATCEAHDPRPRWTDRLPVPVLVLAWLQSLGVAALPTVAAYPTLAAFDHVIGRPVVAGVGLVVAVACLVGLVSTLRLHVLGWWIQLVLVVVLWPVSLAALVTTSPETWQEAARAWGAPAMAASIADTMTLYRQPAMAVPLGAFFVVMLVFLFMIRRHFRRAPAGA